MILLAGSTVSFRLSSGGLHDRATFAEIGNRLAGLEVSGMQCDAV